MVYEAVNPVKITSLDNWINRGQNKSYRVLRYRTKLSSEQIQAIKSYSQKQLGKSYDLKFQWSDGKMYCSELVWKAYKAAGIELCKPNKFSDYNINSPLARQAIRQRYGKSINLDEPVVAPSDIFNSWSLRVVKSN